MNKDPNSAGIFAVNAYVRGKPTIITVDDYLPESGGTPIFANVGWDGAIWAPVLEKAWAKVNGNYEKIELGWAYESMRFMSGCHVDYYDVAY